MKSTINKVAASGVVVACGYLVTNYFHGLSLGRWWLAFLILLVVSGVAFLLTSEWLLRYLAGVLLAEMKAIEPETFERRQVVVTPAPESSDDRSAERRRVVRANVQIIADELFRASSIINTEIRDHGLSVYWTRDLSWDAWDSLKAELAGEEGFHWAYSATRDAWDALQHVEADRMSHEDSNRRVLSWEESRIMSALAKADEASKALYQYLADS